MLTRSTWSVEIKLSNPHSKRKWLDGIKYLAVLTVGGGCVYLMQSYFEIPKYVILLFGLAIGYAEYRVGWLKDQIGLAELPKFDDQIAFLDQEAVRPKHELADLNSYPMQIDENEKLFFDNFTLFADVMNQELKDSSWRLQSMADTNVGTIESEGPVFGRKYALNYGAKKNGKLEIYGSYDYHSEAPNVYLRVEIYNARRFPLWILSSLISPIAFMTCSYPGEVERAETMTNTAMLKVLWPLNQQVVNVDELELSFSGNATNYLRRAAVFSTRR